MENIQTVPGLLGWSKDKAHKRSYELLARVGLERSLAHRYPAQLTASQQQRVAIARALAGDPKVLLLDEPFAAVDSLARSELHEFLIGLQGQTSKTIVLVTDDVDEALKLGDQVAILRVGGRLAQVGTPQQLLDEPADAFVDGYLGRDRGYRSLSFVPASALTLDRISVVRDVDAAVGSEPTLMVDREARPIGWADREHPGQVFPPGFDLSPRVRHPAGRARFGAQLTVQPGGRRGSRHRPVCRGRFGAGHPRLGDGRPGGRRRVDLGPRGRRAAPRPARRRRRTRTGSSPKPKPSPKPKRPRRRARRRDEPRRRETSRSRRRSPKTEQPKPAADDESATSRRADVRRRRRLDGSRGDEQCHRPIEPPDRWPTADEVGRGECHHPDRAQQSEYAAEGGHSDSADDAANAEDPDSNSDVDLDALELDLVDDRDPVR